MKTSAGTLFLAVIITVFFTLLATIKGIEYAKERYRVENRVEQKRVSPLIGRDYYVDGDVTLEMLGLKTVALYGVLVAALYAITHAVMGRLVSAIASTLWEANAKIFFREPDKWEPNSSLIFGALWPITAFSIPLLLLALLIGALYRSLWQ